jgi:hypothetical protein
MNNCRYCSTPFIRLIPLYFLCVGYGQPTILLGAPVDFLSLITDCGLRSIATTTLSTIKSRINFIYRLANRIACYIGRGDPPYYQRPKTVQLISTGRTSKPSSLTCDTCSLRCWIHLQTRSYLEVQALFAARSGNVTSIHQEGTTDLQLQASPLLGYIDLSFR